MTEMEDEVTKPAKDINSKKKDKEPLTKKQLLNNHIVLMRKAVRQARVHVINKLSKEAKKLKERKGAESAQEKAKRKADRLLQEIQIIKHLNEDKVSIYALQDKIKLEDILQKSTSSPEERAISRLSHNKVLQVEVQKYRTVNPHWDLQIPVLLERNKDKRRKINKKLAEREASKTNKTRAQPTIPTVEKSNPKNIDNSDGSESESDTVNETLKKDSDSYSESEEEESGESDKADIRPSVTNTPPPSTSKPKNTIKAPVTSPAAEIKKTKKKQNKTLTKRPDIGKSEGTVKVQFLKDLTDLEKDVTPVHVKLDADDFTSASITKSRPKSSFFVGGVDEDEDNVDGPGNRHQQRERLNPQRTGRGTKNPEEFKPIFRKGKLVNKGAKRFPTDRSQKNQRYFDKDFSSNLTPLGNKSDRQEKSDKQFFQPNSAVASAAAEKLHPSWEAKKRQQPLLSEFKGKKIKFDD